MPGARSHDCRAIVTTLTAVKRRWLCMNAAGQPVAERYSFAHRALDNRIGHLLNAVEIRTHDFRPHAPAPRSRAIVWNALTQYFWPAHSTTAKRICAEWDEISC